MQIKKANDAATAYQPRLNLIDDVMEMHDDAMPILKNLLKNMGLDEAIAHARIRSQRDQSPTWQSVLDKLRTLKFGLRSASAGRLPQMFSVGDRVSHPDKGLGTISYVSTEQVSVQWDYIMQRMLGPDVFPAGAQKTKQLTKINGSPAAEETASPV